MVRSLISPHASTAIPFRIHLDDRYDIWDHLAEPFMITDGHTDIFSLNYLKLAYIPWCSNVTDELEKLSFLLSMGIILALLANDFPGILVSGDNAIREYDELTTMKQDFIKFGVPAEFITKDYSGFRTPDSIIRARNVFGLKEIIIISQRFHCERALYISDAVGIEAVGFCAEDVPFARSTKIRSREVVARAVAFIDIHIVGRQPKFLGKREQVNISQ